MAFIKQSSIEEINQVVNIVEVVSDFVELKKVGSNYRGLSPFSNEKTPSFMVTPTKNIFKDYSSGIGGNAVKFLMEHKGMSYPEALKYLAEKYHVALEYDDTGKTISAEERKKLKETTELYQKIMDWAVVQPQKFFLKLTEDHKAKREVFENRKLNSDDVIQWQIGYTPPYSTLLRQTLLNQNRIIQAKALSLVGEQYDKLQDRIIFPIQNHLGEYVGLAGRDLSGNKKMAKFLNPSDTPLYKKEQILYGLNFAIDAIRNKGKAFLVEGYNDVIAMHKYGAENTVASCGTNINESQADLLKRFTGRVCIVFDNDAEKKDNPGLKAAIRAIQLFVKKGFDTEVVQLLPGDDPDSFSRGIYHESVTTFGLGNLLDEIAVDGIFFYADILAKQSITVTQTGEAVNELSELIANVYEEHARAVYVKEVAKMFDMPIPAIRKTVIERRKEIDKKFAKEHQFAFYQDGKKDDYELPKKLLKAGVTWDEVKDNILKYGIIIFENQTWVQKGKDAPFSFSRIANFKVEIIQHINSDSDEKSIRLVSLTNEYGTNVTFDTLSTNFVEMRSFKKMVEGRGNFRYWGQMEDYERIKHKLYEEMGDGRLIEQLGWQPEGFWAFNNAVIIDGRVEMLDDNGCFRHKGRQYYIKSGNSLYANMPEKFSNQKRMLYQPVHRPLNNYLVQMRRVHREHSFNMILHVLTTVFSDLIYDRLDFVPMMFLYGEASTGKDQLIRACQAFFGKPQPVIKMTGKANTDKGKIRKFAEFINTMVHMSEYKCVNDYIDEDLKAIWDRDGYTRADSESKYLTEEVPILSTFVGTGNEYPQTDSLITRLIVEEFVKNTFNDEEIEDYSKLKGYIDEGVSGYLVDLLNHRPLVMASYRKHYSAVQKELRSDLTNIDLADRMLNNVAALGAFIPLLQDVFPFPFTFDEWKKHIKIQLEKQSNKRNTGSVIAHFWDCFLYAIKEKQNPIHLHQEFDVNGDDLYIRFSLIYPRYKMAHFQLFRENGLSKSVLQDKLKNTDAFQGNIDSYRFGPGSKSSAFKFSLEKTGIKDDFLQILEFKESQNRYKGGGSSDDFTEPKKNNEDDDLPF